MLGNDFLANLKQKQDYNAGLAEQAAKANAYDQAKAASEAQAMAQFYTQQGAQLGFQEGVKQAPTLYAQNELQRDAEFNRMNYGADYSRQVPVQVPAGAQQGARIQGEPVQQMTPGMAEYMARIRANKEAQSRGQ